MDAMRSDRILVYLAAHNAALRIAYKTIQSFEFPFCCKRMTANLGAHCMDVRYRIA